MVNNTNPGNYIIHGFEDPPKNLGLFCPCAQKFISQWKSSLFTLVGFRSKPARKSSLLSKVRYQYCNTELHPGKSFQIPEVFDSDAFYKSMMPLPLISTEPKSRRGLFQIHQDNSTVVCDLHPILCVTKEKGYLPHIFLLGILYVPQLRIQWSPLTTYVQTAHSSILKSGEKWIWSLSLFKIPCKASNSSVSRVLLFWKNTGFSSSAELWSH